MGFYGAGCPHPGVEILVAKINQSCLGTKLQLVVEMMVLELGISLQPLQESHNKYSTWVTSGWLKSLWETMDMFDITAAFNNIPLKTLRDGNKWLVLEFVPIGYGRQELLRLN